MDFFEVVSKRRSIRKFTQSPFPDVLVERALEAAILAPNSSNVQTWDFYWVKKGPTYHKLIHYCLDQSAARTSSHLVVITSDPKKWKRSHQPILKWVKNANAPKLVHTYYEKLIPITYRWGLFNCFAPLKWVVTFVMGLFRPIARGPYTLRDLQEVGLKSAALAAENFVLSIIAQGGAACMMEGFDECRVKRCLRMGYSARIGMVIALGYEAERGTWGPQFRLPLSEVVKVVT